MGPAFAWAMAEAASAHQAASATHEDTSQQRAGRRRRTSADPQRAQQGATAAAADGPAALHTLSRLQQLANASPQVAQLRRLQALADGRSAPVAQLAGGPEEEELIQGKFATAEHPAQLQQAPRANNTGLPDQLKSGIESLSGLSMDHVRVHYNSAQPAQLNALAYAQGSDIHLAPGQERHLPHEAWHVVQQAQGRVRPTLQLKEGVAINGDPGLEHEADAMGAKAASWAASPTGRMADHAGAAARGAAGRPAAPTPAAGEAVLQPKLGFELEMLVLVDMDGRPMPEKVDVGTVGPHLELTVDQNAAVEGPTPTRAADADFTVSKTDRGVRHDIHYGAYDLPAGWTLDRWKLVAKDGAVVLENANRATVQQEFDRRNGGGSLKRVYRVTSWVGSAKQVVEKLEDPDAPHPNPAPTTGWRLLAPDGQVVRNFAPGEKQLAEKALAARSHGDSIEPVYRGTREGQPIETGTHPVIGAGMERYASIVEIVTKAYDPETQAGFAAIHGAMENAAEFAAALESATSNFSRRVRLRDVAGAHAASDDIWVGNTNVPHQTTNASIQSTFAVDIAKLPAYFKALEQHQQPDRARAPFGLKHHADTSEKVMREDQFLHRQIETGRRTVYRAYEELMRAPVVATQVINDVGKTTGAWFWKKDYTLENLRGLITLMAQYLLMGKYFYEDANDLKGGLDKNLAAMLSRTNLSTVFASLPADERTYVSKQFSSLRSKIRQHTGRTGASTLFTDPSETVWNPRAGTVDQFIQKVFKERDDGVTNKFGGFHKMGMESIDPENRRQGAERGKTAPVFELRNMIPKEVTEDAGDRFTKDKWVELADFQAGVLSVLNKLSDAESREELTLDEGQFGMTARRGGRW